MKDIVEPLCLGLEENNQTKFEGKKRGESSIHEEPV